ncbi:hypothetical protein JMUB7504_27320 [Staphylococcus aureus]
MDNMNLKEIDRISKNETTDKKSKEYRAIQKDVKKNLIPKCEEYYKSKKD